ncbi:hypothetical protein FPOA_13173 [Fusarium poae]|uniref:NmrA-like domain-containing protein n=1 Tax=Fusarium poae TaxID=36050 RepID=A0A1B8A6I0_FUSPO|nr:hypothetical protein FPOA_13173 [Fusarium poae]
MLNVTIVGATGETGRSIVDGLLRSDLQCAITAITREESLQKPAAKEIEARGVKLVAANLRGPQEDLVKILTGVDVLISAIFFPAIHDEIPLAKAAKAAGVKRFVPCSFGTPCPPGVMMLRDTKEEMFNNVLRLGLPYTLIDVGWWYQLSLPRVASGRFDYALFNPVQFLLAGGEVPSALTDLRDVGMYVAKIISDERTLNKKVLAYTELKTQNEIFDLVEKKTGEKPEVIPNEIFDLVEKKTGEKPEVIPMSSDEIVSKLQEVISSDDGKIQITRGLFEYLRSWGVRGDNTPEFARYLGYLIADDLYPGFKGRTFESYVQEVVDGKARMVHKDLMAKLQQIKP